MRDANLAADLVFWMRPGGHSITGEDWYAWLGWLDQVMPQGDEVPVQANTASVAPNN